MKIGLAPALAVLAAAGVAATVALGLIGGDAAPPGLSSSAQPSGSTSASPSSSASASSSASGGAPVADPAGPRFPMVTRTAAELAGGRVDLYVPLPGSAGRERERYPLVLLLTDPRIDTSQYEQFAHEIGSYGLAVVVTSRPSGAVLREVKAWAATVEADPDTYLNGLVASEVSFLVVHDGARPDRSTWRQVRGAVVVTPREETSPAGSVGVPLLRVCGTDAAGGCGQNVIDGDRATIDGAVPLSVTDQGKRTPRTFGDVTPERLRTIAALAQPTGVWLLAHNGDPVAQQQISGLLDDG